MSCFWDGLIGALSRRQLIRPGTRPRQLTEWLKAHNRLTVGVRWQGEELSDQLLRENYERIRTHDPNDVDGYLTGSCDPFLLLVAHLFRIDIEHQMMGYDGRYTPLLYSADDDKCTLDRLRFQSNMGHFSIAPDRTRRVPRRPAQPPVQPPVQQVQRAAPVQAVQPRRARPSMDEPVMSRPSAPVRRVRRP